MILKTMFSPFLFIFVILELNFFLSVTHWGVTSGDTRDKTQIPQKNVAHWGCTMGAPSVDSFTRKFI